ncbi:unnamed protein product [Knipowitschia caucasica]|uniref:C2H2-type domain-containing protein n=1 Tax=Knipowitschia caucasica TaxID=637954 RepID=A0AAV2M0W3_KNICA
MFNAQSQLRAPSEQGPVEEARQRFHCQECGKQYNTQLGFRRHLVAAHSTAGAPVCPQTPPSLLEQLGSHTDRPPPPEAAVPIRERKYSCERCDRRFYTRKDVRRHAVVHTGRRDFLCPRCAQRFGRRDHLTRHLKKSHAQEPTLISPPSGVTTPSPAQCSVKEEPCELKEPESFCREMYSSYASPMPPSSLTQASGMSRHMTPPPPMPPQAYSSVGRYQHSSTSYSRPDVDSFLLELQSAPPPHHTVGPGPGPGSSPQREVLGDGELSCTTNLLGFLPFGLPPYSAHMGMGGLVMNYPPSSSSPSSSAGLSSQGPGSFFLQPSQSQVPPAAGSHTHNQLPQAYGSSGPSGALPHYYQAFQ